MTKTQVTVQPFDEISQSLVKTFVKGCQSTEDLAITSEATSGNFICPVLKKEVQVIGGVCQETRGSCEQHY